MPENEIWVDLKSGNEAVDNQRYRISNFGKVVNRFGRTLSVFEKHRFRKQDGSRYTKDDYLTVGLYDGSKHCNFAIHRLVYMSFIGPIFPEYDIHHIDNDKRHNYPENLKMVSKAEHAKLNKMYRQQRDQK